MKSRLVSKPTKIVRAAAARVGTAGWNVAKQYADDFPLSGSHLERYATVFRAVEINSSFYRPHRHTTYARWASSVPEDFRFAVKMPKAITHESRLENTVSILDRFLTEISELGRKLGPILIQLPPSLKFQPDIVAAFFTEFRDKTTALACCEPRHASWFVEEAHILLATHRIARVIADPPPVPEAANAGGWPKLRYRRLHGSPRIYYSDYAADALGAVSDEIDAEMKAGIESWCIFDNTAAFAATGNALTLRSRFTGLRMDKGECVWSG